MSWFQSVRQAFGPGVHPRHRKDTAELETREGPAPAKIVLPVSQHIGAPCKPLVKAGDPVAAGQKIADSEAFVSAPVHSGVSGKVAAVTEVILPGGQACPAVVIESDGEGRVAETVRPPVVENREDFLAAVRESGLVGLGGAGFPTHAKLRVKEGTVIDFLIVNAAECEPYITSDCRECLENTDDVLDGICAVMRFLEIPKAVIGIEDNKPKAAERLRAAAARRSGYDIRVKVLGTRYPQGAEKVLIAACTGRRVPAGRLPADVGCVVMNVTTLGFLARYLRTGMPLTEKRITVAGSAVANPANLRVTVGTPVADVLAACGLSEDTGKILMGGPMMGLALADTDLPVLKQNNAILAFSTAEAVPPPESACIRCGRCVRACPMKLEPVTLESAFKREDPEALESLGIGVCIECGCCSYTCPARRQLVQTMRLSKQMLRKAKEKSRKAENAS